MWFRNEDELPEGFLKAGVEIDSVDADIREADRSKGEAARINGGIPGVPAGGDARGKPRI